jgi:hypothetical protein
MVTPRIYLAMTSAGAQLPEGMRADFERIAPPVRLWALAALLASWFTQKAKIPGYDFTGDQVYVSSLAGRYSSLRPFVEAAAQAADPAALDRAAAAFSYFVQVAGLNTLEGILRLSALDRILVAVPPPIDGEAVREAAKLVSRITSASRVRGFDAPRFGTEEGGENV